MRALGVSPVLLAGSAPRYDLVVQGGRVIDPSRSVSERLDIGIAGGVITRLASDIPESDARQILDARETGVSGDLPPLRIDRPYRTFESDAGAFSGHRYRVPAPDDGDMARLQQATQNVAQRRRHAPSGRRIEREMM